MPELLATVDGEWTRLLRAADALGAGRQKEPLLEGGWSARDVLGHVRLYDAWLLGALVPGRREPQEPYRGYLTEPEDLHRRNRRHLERDRALPAAEVRRSAEATHALVRDALAGLTDADLARTYTVVEDGVALAAGGRPLARLIAVETHEHYAEHAAGLERAAATAPEK